MQKDFAVMQKQCEDASHVITNLTVQHASLTAKLEIVCI